MMKLLAVLLATAALWPRLSAAASAEQWRSQVVYFLLTDRFAPSPGVKPAPCQLNDWNNGTWSGVAANLNMLQDMGMTAVWITPIPYQFQGKNWGASAYHGYWAQDWTRVEPHHGTERDLQDMIKAAHDRGMLTMLDVVGNHAGPIGTNYASVTPFNKPEHYHDCSGCTEHCSIPQEAYASADVWPVANKRQADLVKHCRLVDLADLNQEHPYVRKQLRTWLQDTLQKFPFDAIRIDTVKHVDMGFWADFTNTVDVFSIGEVLNGNTRALPEYVQAGTDGRKPMHSVLNFPIYYKLTNVFAYKQDMRQLAAEVKLQHEVLGADVVPLLGNFVENHDFPRFLTLQPDVALYKNALAWMLLGEGIPILYYGAASGMAGGTEDNKNRGCLWDQPYDRQSDLYRLIAALSKLRTSRRLWNVTQRHEAVTEDCYAVAMGPEVLLVTTNRGSAADDTRQACSIVLPEGSQLLRAGLAGVQDVLAPATGAAAPGGAPAGVSWDAQARRLTVATPGGSPRVLASHSTKRSHLEAGGGGAGGGASTDIHEIGTQDDSTISWGKAPKVPKSAAGGRGALLRHAVMAWARAAGLAAVLAGAGGGVWA